MVERFKQVRDGRLGWRIARRSDGDLCRYADYAALQSENERLKEERETWRIRAAINIRRHRAEASAAVKVPTDEVQRYISRCREMSIAGLSKQEIAEGRIYSWWSRLAEILSTLTTQPAAPLAAHETANLEHNAPQEAEASDEVYGYVCEKNGAFYSADVKDASGLTPVYTSPPAQAVTEAARLLHAAIDPDNDLKTPEQFNAWAALDLALTAAQEAASQSSESER